jgi:uncharacterized LabA/DUF88 family protein
VHYGVTKVFYFGGIEVAGYAHDYLTRDTVDLELLEQYLEQCLSSNREQPNLVRSVKQVAFYKKLEAFGYELILKPVKTYKTAQGERRKANCDVDLTLYAVKEEPNYQRAVIASGDGDFLPVLKYVRAQSKSIAVLTQKAHVASEIRKYADHDLKNFSKLRLAIQRQKN